MIVVSGCNHDGKLMDIEGNVIIDQESRGMVVWRDELYVAMGYDPGNATRGLWRVDPVARTRELVFDHAADLHGVFARDDGVYAIDARNTRIYRYDGCKTTEIAVDPVFTRRHHLNDMFMDGEDEWSTCFGIGLSKNGKVVDERFADTNPHSPVINRGNWYYCASIVQGIAWDGFLRTGLGGFTRGLMIDDEVHVGLSRMRHSEGKEVAAVLTMSLDLTEVVSRRELPCLEIYSICRI